MCVCVYMSVLVVANMGYAYFLLHFNSLCGNPNVMTKVSGVQLPGSAAVWHSVKPLSKVTVSMTYPSLYLAFHVFIHKFVLHVQG